MIHCQASIDLIDQTVPRLDPQNSRHANRRLTHPIVDRLFPDGVERNRLALSNAPYCDSGLADGPCAIGGEPLYVLHEKAGVIHLDLCPDNIGVTERGVGFVDFGSAVRVNESLNESSMLESLFDEMMSTSQIQRVLGKMMIAGRVTSRFICDSHQKVDKAVDVFYLALHMTKPHSNPDFKGLMHHYPHTGDVSCLTRRSAKILRP